MLPLSVLLFILHYIDAFEHIKVVKKVKKIALRTKSAKGNLS